MFQLDPRTVIFNNFIYTLCITIFIFIGSLLKKYPFKGLRNWIVAFLLISLNFLIISLRGLIPNWFVFIVPHCMVIWAYIELKRGLCLFYTIKNRVFTDSIFSIIFLFLLINNNNDVRLRIIEVCILSILIFIDTIHIISTSESKSVTKSRIIPVIYIIACIVMFVRLLLGYQWKPDGNPLTTGNNLSTISILFFIVNMVIFLGLLFIVINRLLNERNILILQLREASLTDELTGLMNRRGFKNITKYEVNRFARTKKGFTFVFCDIDHFKSVNDQYGHDCGDFVLKIIGKMLIDSLRDIDTSARWGGEEFVLLLPETDLEQAGIVLERIRKELEIFNFRYNENSYNITMSFGATHTNLPDKEVNTIIKKADENLYKAKNSGRNRVIMSEIS